METPASLPKKKPHRKKTKPKASDVVPRKSARFASKVNQDQDQEAAVHSEAIWGVMIALVFFAIFEPDDENKS